MAKRQGISEFFSSSSKWPWRKLNTLINGDDATEHQTVETFGRRDSFFSRIEESLKREAMDAAKKSKDSTDKSRHTQRYSLQGIM
jgi:hypothetical protein